MELVSRPATASSCPRRHPTRFARSVTFLISANRFAQGIAPSNKLYSTASPPSERFENTYRLGLAPSDVFKPSRAEAVMIDVLEQELGSGGMATEAGGPLSCRLADMIKDRIKVMRTENRYKIVCHIIIGNKAGHSMVLASQCLWDEAKDNWASVSYPYGNKIVTAIVYAVYFE